MNRVEITGNLARVPEMGKMPSGTSVLDICVAVNERWRDSSGEYVSRAEFIDCKVYGNRADALANWLDKGTKVAVSGKLRKDTWEDKQTGQNRSRVYVIVDDIDFMSKRSGNVTEDDAAYAASRAV